MHHQDYFTSVPYTTGVAHVWYTAPQVAPTGWVPQLPHTVEVPWVQYDTPSVPYVHSCTGPPYLEFELYFACFQKSAHDTGIGVRKM